MSNTNITEHNCPICLEMLTLDNNYCETECGHTYHTSCLLQVKGCCPMCRHELGHRLTLLTGDEEDDLYEQFKMTPEELQTEKGAISAMLYFRRQPNTTHMIITNNFISRILDAHKNKNQRDMFCIIDEYRIYRNSHPLLMNHDLYDLLDVFCTFANCL